MSKKAFFATAIGVISFLSASSFAQDSTEEELDVHTLARVIFPAEQAKKIVSYRPDKSIVSGAPWPSVTLLSQPEEIVSGVCRQETYHVDLPLGRGTHPSTVESAIVQWTDIAIADSCASLDPKSQFARIQPRGTDPMLAARELVWLRRAVQEKGSDRPKFLFKCVSDITPSGCGRKPAEVFANLSFEKLFLIEKMGLNSWDFIFSIYNKGGPIWIVSVTGMKGPNPTVTMKESIPAPF